MACVGRDPSSVPGHFQSPRERFRPVGLDLHNGATGLPAHCESSRVGISQLEAFARVRRSNASSSKGTPTKIIKIAKEESMAKKSGTEDSVYKVVEVIGTSTKSWEDAARVAVETAAGSLRNLRIAEVAKMDLKVEHG